MVEHADGGGLEQPHVVEHADGVPAQVGRSINTQDRCAGKSLTVHSIAYLAVITTLMGDAHPCEAVEVFHYHPRASNHTGVELNFVPFAASSNEILC